MHAFHKAHNELTDWLVSAEQTLQTVESHPNAEQVMETLEKEVRHGFVQFVYLCTVYIMLCVLRQSSALCWSLR